MTAAAASLLCLSLLVACGGDDGAAPDAPLPQDAATDGGPDEPTGARRATFVATRISGELAASELTLFRFER